MSIISTKKLKYKVFAILGKDNPQTALKELLNFPLKKVVNPLFSALLHPEEKIRWHGISAFGLVVNEMAKNHMEDARIVMRRFMWMLNDESGGIGWGVPEAMGEIMAVNSQIANEYHTILFSYLQENEQGKDNFLEYAPLRRGAYWGTARLAQKRPNLGIKAQDKILAALNLETDAYILVYSILFLKILKLDIPKAFIPVISRHKHIKIYWNYLFVPLSSLVSGLNK
ncbi:DVU0298 family protein [Desulfonauticus submarinus]